MTAPSPALTEALVLARMQDAPHGQRGAMVDALAAETGKSRATIYRMLRQVTVQPARRQRTDAGAHALSRKDAETISAFLTPHHRANGKAGATMDDALRDLRANGLIRAERTDPDTGELVPLSASAVARALRAYGLHPAQLRRLPPAQRLRSLHPNHVWQMDASVPTLFYLDDDGSQPMPEHVFYKNRPDHYEAIARKRVTRFVMTDHTSGTILVRYYLGGESEAAFTEFFIWAIQRSARGTCPVHGVPQILMVDPGSGMAAQFKNMLRRLRCELIVNKPGNPRAKGQVEKAQDIVERRFESQFRAHNPRNLAELNQRAQEWMDHHNATAVHTRTGMTRYQKWLEITPEQLRVAPDVAMCRRLLTAQPKACRVDNQMQVAFGGQGRRWDVRGVPDVLVGEKLTITWNPYDDTQVFAVFAGADGEEVLHPCPLVTADAHGFAADAVVIGERYEARADTPADAARKRLARLATGETSDEAAAVALRERSRELMAGRVRYDHLERENQERAPLLPRAGTPLAPTSATPPVPARVLSHFEAARALADRLGAPLMPAQMQLMRQLHPDGVPEDQTAALAERLHVRATLRVVGSDATH